MTIPVNDVDMNKSKVIVRQSRVIRWLTVAVVVLLGFGLFMAWLCLENELQACEYINSGYIHGATNDKQYCVIEIK